MSREASDWAWRQHAAKSADKFVLLALANAADRVSWEAWPSVPALSAATQLNRKQVIAALDRLERLHLIADEGRRVGRTMQVKVYRVCPTVRETDP